MMCCSVRFGRWEDKLSARDRSVVTVTALNGKKIAHGSLLLGICADERSFRDALGNDCGNVPQAFERQEILV